MLLTIDIGNSNVVIGCLNEEYETIKQFRMVTDLKKTEDEYAAGMQAILLHNGIDGKKFSGAIICSVVPPLTDIFKIAVERLTGCNALVVGTGVKTGLSIMIENPASLGSDLVAVSVAAMVEYPLPAIVIDMGTATTFSVINKEGAFCGGSIMAGVGLSLNALTNGTAQLPAIDLTQPPKVCGTNTVDCMSSGVIYGAASMVDGMIDRLEEELKEQCTVIATGGIAKLVVPHCKHEITLNDDLLLQGLADLYYRNKK